MREKKENGTKHNYIFYTAFFLILDWKEESWNKTKIESNEEYIIL